MIKVSLDEIEKIFDGLINGTLNRDYVAEWAQIRESADSIGKVEYDPTEEGNRIWLATTFLRSVGLKDFGGKYLYSIETVSNFREELKTEIIGRERSIYFCRICGLKQLSPPWSHDGKTPNFEICDCCGVEFGYEDCKLDPIRKYRTTWLSNKEVWFDSKKKPPNWSLEKQMTNIPKEYL